ncbi:NAD(P)-binding protein [Lentithecium fluviatile CBS 122367]|uniref:NAD(P)-binding protein n=1 Tax=Lentithecium fluviatile CBS 122367 TaxID=1168545 RepID=A0A6G1IJT5_9PLEO|nr:NAD(P)-binding protein [Lentithecium fluviatile CBS 122367]
MVGSKYLKPPTSKSHFDVFLYNQFRAKPQWPAPNVSLSDKTAIVTGGNTGLGYEAAVQLLGLGLSRLILAVRSPAKGEAAASQLRQLHSKAILEVWKLDMSSYNSVLAFARRVETEPSRIDIVLLNAGLTNFNFTKVESTGHEETIQVNYLSTMLLAVLLLPILKAKRSPGGEPARLTISSAALTLHAAFPNCDANPLLPSFDDPKTYKPQEHYRTSKLLAHMFLWNLVDYVSADDVIVNLADPAFVKGTGLVVRNATGIVVVFVKLFGALFGRTVKLGASCYIDAIVNKGKESHGCFLMSWNVHPFAAFLYTPEGQVVTRRLWDETMAELDFAGIRSILDSLRA